MKRIFLPLAALLVSVLSFAQIAGTSFEEPATYSGHYTDTGDPAVAHFLANNPDEPIVTYTNVGGEMGFQAYYIPYDSPDVGLTDGDFTGVMDFAPSAEVGFTDGEKGFQMNDLDGNLLLIFDEVDLTNVSNPSVSLDFLLNINRNNPANGNYEGDGTINESGHDRLRIYIKDLTNNEEIFLFDSTGSDLDDFVPFDSNTGEYQLEWQSVSKDLTPNTTVQLVIEGRTNASDESFWFDNIVFDGAMGIHNQASKHFSIFPNPTSKGYVNIISETGRAKSVTVFDILGKEVIKKTLNGTRLNVSDLKSGIYIIQVVEGKTSITNKLVIK